MKKLRIAILASMAALLLGCVLLPTPAPTIAPPTQAAAPAFTATPTLTAPAAPTTPSTVPPTATSSPATATQTPGASGGTPSLVAPPPYAWDDLTPYRQAMLPAFAADVERFADATRYWIDWTIDVQGEAFSGAQQVRYTNHEDVPLAQVVFRLLPNTPGYGGSMAVSAATVNGDTAATELRLDDSALYVSLPTPLQPGEEVDLALAFEGLLPTDPSNGYAQYGYFDGVLALPNAYPMIPVYDDEGWNAEVAPSYGDATFTDTSLYLARITLPADMVLATSGITLERQENGDGTASFLCASGPMRDFNLVASAAYDSANSTIGQVLVTSYYLPDQRGGGQRALDYAAESLRIYEERVGPYPFNELDVLATPTLAGGIEYPGLIVVAERLYGQVGGFFELAAVHEVAHQWWYSLVGNDQVDEPWLDEALAQYTSLLYVEDRYGEDAAQRLLEQTFEAPYQRLQESGQDMPIGLPVASYPQDLYGPVVYGKGPLFFSELRDLVGDEVFEQILDAYFEQYRYNVAYPQDFLAVAERVSGQNLDGLYEKWVLGTGG